MKIFSTSLAPSLTVVALGIAIVTGFTASQPSHSADELTPSVTAAHKSIRQESISQDYAKAHQALMEKPDEPPVNAF